jgi:hypothetical protein
MRSPRPVRPCPDCGTPKSRGRGLQRCASCQTAARQEQKKKYGRKPCVGCGGEKAPGRGYRWCENCISRGAPEQRKRQYKSQKRRELFWRYGISAEDYEAMLVRQGGVCAMCGMEYHTGRLLCVDHDHATGKVRGLLCIRCNAGLGYIESAEWMEAAMRYLAENGRVCSPLMVARKDEGTEAA